MKGFIEIPLLLILTLLSPIVADLNQELSVKLNLLAKSKMLDQKQEAAESDLNYYILNDKNIKYEAKNFPSETILAGQDFTLQTFTIESKATKTIAQSAKQRLFNWNKATKEFAKSDNCIFSFLELVESKLFNCQTLIINHLRIKSSSMLINIGEIRVDSIAFDASNLNPELIAYQNLRINEIQTTAPKNNSLLIFSQIGQTFTQSPMPNCNQLAWGMSSKYKQEQCFTPIKTSAYWPTMKIISSNPNTQLP